jgi:hypothetical protein
MSLLDSAACTLPAPLPSASVNRILATLKLWSNLWQGRRDLARRDALFYFQFG